MKIENIIEWNVIRKTSLEKKFSKYIENVEKINSDELLKFIIDVDIEEDLINTNENKREIDEIINRLENILLTKTKSDFYHLFRLVYELFITKFFEEGFFNLDKSKNDFYWKSSSFLWINNIVDEIVKEENSKVVWEKNISNSFLNKEGKIDRKKMLDFKNGWINFLNDCKSIVNNGSHFSEGMFQILPKEDSIKIYSKIIFLLSMIINDKKIYDVHLYEEIRKISRVNKKFEIHFNIGEHGGVKIDATLLSFGLMIKGGFKIKIPFYQRGYVWKEKDYNKFFESVENFKGNITYSSSGRDEIEIIDGQQRIITLLIVKFVIYDGIKNGRSLFNEIKKHINWESQKMMLNFKEFITNEESFKIKKILEQKTRLKKVGIENFFFTATIVNDFKSKVNIFRDLNIANVPFEPYEKARINFINSKKNESIAISSMEKLYKSFGILQNGSKDLEKILWSVTEIYFNENNFKNTEKNIQDFFECGDIIMPQRISQLLLMIALIPSEVCDVYEKNIKKINLSNHYFVYRSFGADLIEDNEYILPSTKRQMKYLENIKNPFENDLEKNDLIETYFDLNFSSNSFLHTLKENQKDIYRQNEMLYKKEFVEMLLEFVISFKRKRSIKNLKSILNVGTYPILLNEFNKNVVKKMKDKIFNDFSIKD